MPSNKICRIPESRIPPIPPKTKALKSVDDLLLNIYYANKQQSGYRQ
jgi:hypothetical protein